MNDESAIVFIVDDDEAIRQSLSMLVRTVGFEARAYPSADAFLRDFGPHLRGCLVLDIRMPGTSGLELQRKLSEINSTLPIVFITGHGDIPMAVEAVKAGAIDFIPKPFRDQDLLDSIHRALDLSAERQREAETRQAIQARLASLTPREREVLGLVADGKANKVVASDLGLSERTVEIHRSRVMHKMQADSLAHLVRLVLGAGDLR